MSDKDLKPWDLWHWSGGEQSVLQNWVMRLPLRFQGSLITAVRGCDLAPKFPLPANETYVAENGRALGADRELVAYLRFCCLHPADPREVDVPGAFFQPRPPANWKPSQFGHYPEHWYAHIMHAYEIVGFEHPDADVQVAALTIYHKFVHNLHLMPESRTQLWQRLTEDRIVTGTVVS